MDLTITRKHSYRAGRMDVNDCPTVRALEDVGIQGAEVHNHIIKVDGKKYKIPRPLAKAIVRWDEGKSFNYGTYRIAGLKRPKNAEPDTD